MPQPITAQDAARIARRHAPHGGAWLLALASTGRIDHADALRHGPLQDAFRALARHRQRHPADAEGWRELVALAHYIRTHAPRDATPQGIARDNAPCYVGNVRTSDASVREAAHVDTTHQDTRPALLRELDAQIGEHGSHEDYYRTFGDIEDAAGAALHWRDRSRGWVPDEYDGPGFWEMTEIAVENVVMDAQARMDAQGYSRDDSREALAEALDAMFRDVLSHALRQVGKDRRYGTMR